jgi:putative transposase
MGAVAISPNGVADTRQHASEAFDLFVETYEAKYPKAVECLGKDREALLAFYDFPAEHWVHLRTTNPSPGEYQSGDGVVARSFSTSGGVRIKSVGKRLMKSLPSAVFASRSDSRSLSRDTISFASTASARST